VVSLRERMSPQEFADRYEHGGWFLFFVHRILKYELAVAGRVAG
jgi:hypothetical protein